MKVIFKDAILDLVTLKKYLGLWKTFIKFPMLWWRSCGTPECIEENIERSKKDGLESQEERVGTTELRLLCFSQQHSIHRGAAENPLFLSPQVHH